MGLRPGARVQGFKVEVWLGLGCRWGHGLRPGARVQGLTVEV